MPILQQPSATYRGRVTVFSQMLPCWKNSATSTAAVWSSNVALSHIRSESFANRFKGTVKLWVFFVFCFFVLFCFVCFKCQVSRIKSFLKVWLPFKLETTPYLEMGSPKERTTESPLPAPLFVIGDSGIKSISCKFRHLHMNREKGIYQHVNNQTYCRDLQQY